MKIEDIMAEAEKTANIDETNLGRESINTPKIHNRILNIRFTESMMQRKLTFELKKLVQEKRDYYLGRADPSVYKAKPFDTKILKSEVNTYIDADEEVTELALRVEIQQEKVEYLTEVLKQISKRDFLIRNALDFQKLMSGGY